MPKRTDIETILVIGSGPIVIGQACEFDYSGTQACQVLQQEGYRVVLANSNPATIMTDPAFADATYVEPLTLEILTKIIETERPDALLPTLGGQTALNLSMELVEAGVLDKYDVELIGANAEAIETAEDRSKFKEAMIEIGLDVPRSGVAHTTEEADKVIAEIGLPVVVRPAYILGGKGTGIATTPEEFVKIAKNGLAASPISEILIEESIAGWKEYELEVMRDSADNQVIICGIENVDPMGVHTGDSITVAPIQTLTDTEYQQLRDASFACLRRAGVETGGSNVQFAVDPESGRWVVIEMNPRVSRSSALASKATGFPIAKIAAKLAIGYTLDEIPNDITKKTPASFEPVIDYVVTKIPKWAFEKLPGTPAVLGTAMQSVGEVMAIGRTFSESLQKACRSLEAGHTGLNCSTSESRFDSVTDEQLLADISIGTPDRIFATAEALRRGIDIETVFDSTKIDPWFLTQMQSIVDKRNEIESWDLGAATKLDWKLAKQAGFSDAQIGYLHNVSEDEIRKMRLGMGVKPTYKTVDTCGGEFEANTPYYYSTYEDEDEVAVSDKPKVIILGSGPNRIGQGIEFDYCCVHASYALSEAGYATIMVNCNPETVSTDYDTSDRLYFEPITLEDVTNIIEAEQPKGVIVSLGGQTPLKLAGLLPEELVLGTTAASIDLAEDRDEWNQLCERLGIPQPAGSTAASPEEAVEVANAIGYPALVRPSYVLGGRAMEIVYSEKGLRSALEAMEVEGSLGREGGLSADRPVLVDKFAEGAIEVDFDAIRDSSGEFIVGGIMEHVEEAGIHSGDSACMLPPQNLSAQTQEQLKVYAQQIADALDVVGLINIQLAITHSDGKDEIFVIEANPRASRTVPFVSKATSVPLAKVASRVMAGEMLVDLRKEGILEIADHSYVAIKEAVLPFNRFPLTDSLLGPEMKSTGEVMGIDENPGLAFIKSQLAAGMASPGDSAGKVFLSLADRDKTRGVEVAKQLISLGYTMVATAGTAKALKDAGLSVETIVNRLSDSDSGTILELIEAGEIAIVINTPRGRGARADGAYIRLAAGDASIPLLTAISGAESLAKGLIESKVTPFSVRPLQSIHVGGSA